MSEATDWAARLGYDVICDRCGEAVPVHGWAMHRYWTCPKRPATDTTPAA